MVRTGKNYGRFKNQEKKITVFNKLYFYLIFMLKTMLRLTYGLWYYIYYTQKWFC